MTESVCQIDGAPRGPEGAGAPLYRKSLIVLNPVYTGPVQLLIRNGSC